MILQLALKKAWRFDSLSGLQMVQLIRYGSLFLISIALVKSSLDQHSIGNFETVLLLTGAVSFFWVTGIIQALLPLFQNSKSLTIPTDSKDAGEIFNAFISLLLFSLLAALVVIFVGEFISDLANRQLDFDLKYYVAVFVFLQSPSALVEYIYLLRKRTGRLVRYGWLMYGFQFLSVAIVALFGMSLEWILLALIGSAAVRFIWVCILVYKVSFLRFSLKFQKEHLTLGLPIIISVLLSGSALYVDGMIVLSYFDQGTLAIFRYGARELPLVALLAHALSTGIIPTFTQEGLHSGLQALKKRTKSLVKWLFPTTAILLLGSYFLFPLFYDEQYLASAGVFNVYLLLIITRLVFPQTVLIAYKKTRILMIAAALELVMNIGLSLLFVQWLGLPGIALATLLAYLFERLILILYVRVILGIHLVQYTPLKLHAIWSGIIVLLYLLVELWLGPLLLW